MVLVGSKTTPGDTCPDKDHWGAAGWQISDTPTTIDGLHPGESGSAAMSKAWYDDITVTSGDVVDRRLRNRTAR